MVSDLFSFIFLLCFPSQGRTFLGRKTYVLQSKDIRPRYGDHKWETSAKIMQAVWQSQVFQGLFKRIFANNQYEYIFNIIRIMFNLIKWKADSHSSFVIRMKCSVQTSVFNCLSLALYIIPHFVKSCCTRRHGTSHNYEFGIMAKQERTNLLFVLDYTFKFPISFCRFSKKRAACAPSICVWWN